MYDEDNVDLEEGNRHPRDNLESHIEDYNEMFGTNYSTDDFGSYYVDVSKRSKNKQIDILLVVNNFKDHQGEIVMKRPTEQFCGKFELTATANGSSTDVEYEITFTGTNIPTNMKFYLNKQKTNKLDLTKGLKGYFNSDDTDKTKVYTIYWEWPFDSGENNQDDINY